MLSGLIFLKTNQFLPLPPPPPPPSPPYPKLGCSVLFSTERDPLLSTGCLLPDSGTTLFKLVRYSFSGSIPPKIEHKLRRHKQRFGKIATNNNELYLHDHTSTYSIAKAMFIGVIFTRARVSLRLLSLRKNGGLLVVYKYSDLIETIIRKPCLKTLCKP